MFKSRMRWAGYVAQTGRRGKHIGYSRRTMMLVVNIKMYEVASESSRNVVVTASMKDDERAGQDHTSASLLHQSAT
jgi:hypothetical protein